MCDCQQECKRRLMICLQVSITDRILQCEPPSSPPEAPEVLPPVKGLQLHAISQSHGPMSSSVCGCITDTSVLGFCLTDSESSSGPGFLFPSFCSLIWIFSPLMITFSCFHAVEVERVSSAGSRHDDNHRVTRGKKYKGRMNSWRPVSASATNSGDVAQAR